MNRIQKLLEDKLVDILPQEFTNGEYFDTQAYKFKDEEVIVVHSSFGDSYYKHWPGKERYVHKWVELKNGYAVGWNENPSRGWSFPVIKL